jgi:hypothetical protein
MRRQAPTEPVRDLARVVGQDGRGAGAAEGQQRLEHGAVAVDPAVRGGRFDHRVLARDLVGADGDGRGRGDLLQHVEIGETGLDHHEVRALGDVELELAQRLTTVGRVLLVGAAVPGQRGVHRLAERAVEGGGVLRGVGVQRDLVVAGAVERVADRGDLAVHHPRGAQQVRPGLGLGEGHLAVAHEGRVVVHAAVGVEHAAVPVVGELVQAQVGHDHGRVAELGAQAGEGPVEDPVRVGRAGAHGVLVLGHAEQHHPADAALGRLGRGAHEGVHRVLLDAGHRADRAVLARALAHEHGQHEVGGAQGVLPHEGAHRGAAAEAAGPVERAGEGRAGQGRAGHRVSFGGTAGFAPGAGRGGIPPTGGVGTPSDDGVSTVSTASPSATARGGAAWRVGESPAARAAALVGSPIVITAVEGWMPSPAARRAITGLVSTTAPKPPAASATDTVGDGSRPSWR